MGVPEPPCDGVVGVVGVGSGAGLVRTTSTAAPSRTRRADIVVKSPAPAASDTRSRPVRGDTVTRTPPPRAWRTSLRMPPCHSSSAARPSPMDLSATRRPSRARLPPVRARVSVTRRPDAADDTRRSRTGLVAAPNPGTGAPAAAVPAAASTGTSSPWVVSAWMPSSVAAREAGVPPTLTSCGSAAGLVVLTTPTWSEAGSAATSRPSSRTAMSAGVVGIANVPTDAPEARSSAPTPRSTGT